MNYFWIIAVIVVLIILFGYMNFNSEGFVDYTQYPYGYMKTGSDPVYFYRKDRFRKPYDDGFRLYKSYPLPHLEMNP